MSQKKKSTHLAVLQPCSATETSATSGAKIVEQNIHPAPKSRKPKKARADVLAFEQGLAESKEAAERLIMAGKLYLVHPNGDSEVVSKAGNQYSADSRFELQGIARFVSRGAYKLLTAIDYFSLNVEDMVALDAGASTGGFTDCLLQHGAKRVYAVDVGYNQLHERLRSDERVISMESTNLRDAPINLLPEQVDIVVADVSFISLTAILPSCVRFLKADGLAAVLIKPQFEVGSAQTDKGVVRDEGLRKAAIDKVTIFAQEVLGMNFLGIVPSAIKGPKGNQEYIACFQKTK